jgi:hypothetical protein
MDNFLCIIGIATCPAKHSVSVLGVNGFPSHLAFFDHCPAEELQAKAYWAGVLFLKTLRFFSTAIGQFFDTCL